MSGRPLASDEITKFLADIRGLRAIVYVESSGTRRAAGFDSDGRRLVANGEDVSLGTSSPTLRANLFDAEKLKVPLPVGVKELVRVDLQGDGTPA